MESIRKAAVVGAILFLTAAWYTGRQLGHEDVGPHLASALPEAVRFGQVNGNPRLYAGYSAGGLDPVGYAAVGRSTGYVGQIAVLTGVDQNGRITGVAVLAQQEDRAWWDLLIGRGFLTQFRGKAANDTFTVGSGVDAVTGATLSAKGTASAIREGAHLIARSVLDLPLPEQSGPVRFAWPEATVIMLFLACIAGLLARMPKLRYLTMAVSLIALGWWLKAPLTFSSLAGGMMGFLPPVRESLAWYLLAGGALGSALLLGRNLYCYWICPFGALQELLSAMGGGTTNGCGRREASLQKIKAWLALLALGVALAYRNPSLATYEPFGPVFAFNGTTLQWLLLPPLVVAGLFITRFWCRYLCPNMAVMNWCLQASRAIRRMLHRLRIPARHRLPEPRETEAR